MKIIYKVIFHFQRLLKGHVIRNRAASFVSFFLPRSKISLMDESLDVIDDLKEIGFSPLKNIIDKKIMADITNYLFGKKIYDKYDKSKKMFDLGSVPEWANTGSYSDETLLECPHILRLANNPSILSVVSEYLGAKPTISNITLWHSFPSKDHKPKNAEYFHRDVDDFKFVKVFIYLSDVGEENGPHVYVDGSSRSMKLLDIKRYADEEVFSHFGTEKKRVVLGKKGDAFIEDTYGLHRGTPVKIGIRTVLQFEYSLLPFSVTTKRKVAIDSDFEYDLYTNRLYV
jgi:hypothetical protein